MYASACEGRSLSPAAGRALLGVALLFASAILLASWLQSTTAAPGTSVLVIVFAALSGAWWLERHTRVRGLPLAAGGIMAGVEILGFLLGSGVDAVPPGSTLFIALMLTLYARSWTVGLVSTSILASAHLVAASL